MDNAETVKGLLSHYGVRGMRWGIRRRSAPSPATATSRETPVHTLIKTKGGEHLPAHPDAIAARVIGQKLKKSGKNSVSNEELMRYANRIDLEQRVARLQDSQVNPGQKFAKELLSNIAKQQVTRIANDEVSKRIGSVLEKKSS